MSLPFIREFKLAGSRGDGRHAYINQDGAFIGRGVALLEQDEWGRWKPRSTIILERLFAKGYGAPVTLGWRERQLHHVAQALNKGDLALANISLVHAQLPPLPSADHARAMAKADGFLVKYNPDWGDEPRVPAGDPNGGRWTGGGEDDSGIDTSGLQPVADRVDPTQAKKERFVDRHLADARKVAAQLGVPVENILGVSATESGWGEAHFAAQGNNYFGIHYPAPFATGYVLAGDGKTKVATFSSYADSLKSFVAIAGANVKGIADADEFGAALSATGKFGVGRPTYGRDVGRTIRGLRAIVARHGA